MRKSERQTHNDGLVEIPPFDFAHSQPNPFATRYQEGITTNILATSEQATIMLEPDVAEYFPDSDSVNAALRTLIAALSTIKKPHTPLKKSTRRVSHVKI